MGYRNVLITLDGSELAERALDAALKLAVPGTKLHLLSVIDETATSSAPLVTAMNASFPLYYTNPAPPTVSSISREVTTRFEYINSVKYMLTNQGYEVTAEAYLGHVVETILDVACDFDLLVMATHGRTGLSKFMLGSVTEAVLHKVTCPALVAQAHVPRAAHTNNCAGYNCILIGLDGSAQAEAILPEVEKLIVAHPCKVVLLRVATYTEFNPAALSLDASVLLNEAAEQQAHEYLERIAFRLKELGATPIIEVNLNTPRAEILLSAEYYHADLIAMATHGRTGLSRLLHGSVTEDVLRRAVSPMLIVRAPDA